MHVHSKGFMQEAFVAPTPTRDRIAQGENDMLEEQREDEIHFAQNQSTAAAWQFRHNTYAYLNMFSFSPVSFSQILWCIDHWGSAHVLGKIRVVNGRKKG